MSLLPNSSKTPKATKGVTLQDGKTRLVVMPNWERFGPVYRGFSASTGNAGNLSIALAGRRRGGRVPKCPHFVSDFFLWKRPKNAVPGGLSRALANALALLGISFRCVGDRFAARALPPALPSATTSILTSFRFAGIAFNSLAR
jgi:hypothetical protein